MKKTGIIKGLKTLVNHAETTEVKSMLNLTIKILEMSPRRIEGFISLISGFSDIKPHGGSSENRGIQYRKKSKSVL